MGNTPWIRVDILESYMVLMVVGTPNFYN